MNAYLRLKAKLVREYLLYKNRSVLLRRGVDRDLWKTKNGSYFWLSKDPDAYIDRCIKQSGIFEPASTEIAKRLVKPNDVVFDVGANIGYYSILFAKQAGAGGRVLAFEPTKKYCKVLQRNIAENQLANIDVYQFGLSDLAGQVEIDLGDSSA